MIGKLVICVKNIFSISNAHQLNEHEGLIFFPLNQQVHMWNLGYKSLLNNSLENKQDIKDNQRFVPLAFTLIMNERYLALSAGLLNFVILRWVWKRKIQQSHFMKEYSFWQSGSCTSLQERYPTVMILKSKCNVLDQEW